MYTELVRDALEEFSYNKELAGLDYSVNIGSRGLCFKLSGYNDKLPELLEHVLKETLDLEIKDDRFEIIKERLIRGWANWELKMPYLQTGYYLSWLNSDRSYLVSEYTAELPKIAVESLRQYKPQLLGQLYFELLVHGNMHKEDALRLTDMVESVLQSRPLPRTQWPIQRSLVLPPRANYLYKKTLNHPDNVNHCIDYWLYTGEKGDPLTRAHTLFLGQLMGEPAFDQLRTREQLGYVVFCGVWGFATTYGFRFLVQSEKDPLYLELKINTFIESFKQTLRDMGEKEFENHQRSLVVTQQDTEVVRKFNKFEMEVFYLRKIHAASPERAKLVVQLFAHGAIRPDVPNNTVEGGNPIIIEDVRTYNAGLVASAGPKPARDVIGYED
ncbi:uncharacterized protein DNG_05147 [Cephalotrichum gorgonifer]|uniref:Peptidase_M16_C domain-containing protein n=1 Tax=Cephalotrichum gorgonifer TaxID=2041049 RepID=A0AAE8SVI2_9PEZI|nr:uncharacterized protein DNG_05147 [Cephalotrichum gorgonifer]